MAQLVKITGIVNASESPTGKALHPGDWVEVKNRQTLAKWIANGKAEAPHWLKAEAATAVFQDNCGIVARTEENTKLNLTAFAEYMTAVKVVKTTNITKLPFKHNLIWSPAFPLTKQQFIIGFSLVAADRGGYDAWDMAAMLISDKALANTIGSPKEKEKTKEVIGDNRLPVYDTRVIFVKDTKNTQAIIKAMFEDVKNGGDERHAFLRAIYAEPVKLCTLPPSWLSP